MTNIENILTAVDNIRSCVYNLDCSATESECMNIRFELDDIETEVSNIEEELEAYEHAEQDEITVLIPDDISAGDAISLKETINNWRREHGYGEL